MYGYKPDNKSEKILPYTEENCSENLEKEIFFHFIFVRYPARKKHMPGTVGLL